jgi:hypothetical protein
MKVWNIGLPLLGLLLVTWGAFSIYALYDMAVVRDVYTPQLTLLVAAMSASSLLAGVGMLIRKKWAFGAFVSFAVIFLSGMVYTKDFGMESNDAESLFAILSASVLFSLAGLYLRKQLHGKL